MAYVGTQIEITLTIAEQRKIAEASTGEPCFRVWMTRAEGDLVKGWTDWTFHDLSDGRVAAWRKVSDLTRLERSGRGEDRRLAAEIRSRRIEDGVI